MARRVGRSEKVEILDLLARPAQAAADEFEELDGEGRLLGEDGDEVAAVEGEELAAGHRRRVRGARLAVEEGDLAENVVGADEVEDDLAAVVGGHADLHEPRDDGEEPRARRALAENPVSGRMRDEAGMGGEALDRRRRGIPEELVPDENRSLVDDKIVDVHDPAPILRPRSFP